MTTQPHVVQPFGSAPGVQAVVLTREQKAAGLTADQVQAELAAQAQASAQTMGSRGVQVRHVRGAVAVLPPDGVAAPPLATRILEPPIIAVPGPATPGGLQSGVPPEGAEGAIDFTSMDALAAEIAQLDPSARAALLEQLNATRIAREQAEAERLQREAEEQHELTKHVAAFQPAGDVPRVDVQRVVLHVNVSKAHRIQGAGPIVLEMRGPLEVIVRQEESEHAEVSEAQTPRREGAEEDAPSGKPGQLDPDALDEEAERQEDIEGDHADDIPPDAGPISVGREGKGD